MPTVLADIVLDVGPFELPDGTSRRDVDGHVVMAAHREAWPSSVRFLRWDPIGSEDGRAFRLFARLETEAPEDLDRRIAATVERWVGSLERFDDAYPLSPSRAQVMALSVDGRTAEPYPKTDAPTFQPIGRIGAGEWRRIVDYPAAVREGAEARHGVLMYFAAHSPDVTSAALDALLNAPVPAYPCEFYSLRSPEDLPLATVMVDEDPSRPVFVCGPYFSDALKDRQDELVWLAERLGFDPGRYVRSGTERPLADCVEAIGTPFEGYMRSASVLGI